MVKKFLLWIFAISVIAPLVLVGLLILYVYLDSTGILVSYDNYVFQKKLKQKIDHNIKDFSLNDLTNFKWDEVCVYLPYGGNIDSYIEDGFWSLSFKDKLNDREIKIKVNRGIIDFKNKGNHSSSPNCYSGEIRSIIYYSSEDNNRDYITFKSYETSVLDKNRLMY